MQVLYHKRSCFSAWFVLGIFSLIFLGFPPPLQAGMALNLDTSLSSDDLEFVISKAEAGESIQLSGEFSGNFLIASKTITIIGNKDDPAILNGNFMGPVLRIASTSDVSLKDFITIKNGQPSNPASGGGIQNSGKLKLSHVVVIDNHGSGITNLGQLTLSHVTVKSNMPIPEAGVGGGGIRDAGIGPLEIHHSHISHNTSTDGGGGLFINRQNKNQPGDRVINITHSKIHDNTTLKVGGGGINIGSVDCNISVCEINNNTTTSSFAGGGGIYIFDSKVTISGSKISNNTADPGRGGGVFIGESTVNISKSEITHNFSKSFGGAISYSNSQLTIDKATEDLILHNHPHPQINKF